MNATSQDTTLLRAHRAIDVLQRRLAQAEQQRSAPVAVVGLDCRFPGGMLDERAYWMGLCAGVDAIREVPADRWDVEQFFDGGSPRPGTLAARGGGFIEDVDRFDHAFFGISGREAASMDPQQRLALEVTWNALEQGGIDPTSLAGSRTGVFFGLASSDYAVRSFSHPLDVNAYASTGTAHSVVPGRISYVLGLRGPSLAVDTACSSSLTAVHLACQSLRAGECDTAVVGGVNLILSPLNSIAFSQFGMLSPSSQCRTFDASADGFVRGEGCGVVVLRRASDALRDGNRIQALIRGSAVNQDGRSSGLTAPSPQAQIEVLQAALAAAAIAPDDVDFVELHGTGTPLGDPIEFEALASVYGRGADRPCYLGSVKTNIGHLEAASGIAGLIKAVLALRNAAIPPNLHFTALSPHISFEGTSFAVPTEVVDWPRSDRPRYAGVSSFGFGGSNAHLILGEAAPTAVADRDDRRPQSILTLSARSDASLACLASTYADLLARTPDDDVADLCFSANTGRAALTHRIAAVGSTAVELAGAVRGAAAGRANRDGSTQRGAVFLFTGQGAQRPGMARALYQSQPTFRRVVDACSDALGPVLDVPLTSVLFGGDDLSDLVNQTAYAQPALFAVEYALAELWRSWGVEPAAVIGHSLGEYVACAVAGAMPWEQAIVLVARRARLMQSLEQRGAMAAVSAAEAVLTPLVERYPGLASIAAVNAPDSTVISGDRAVIEAICAELSAAGVRTVPLRVSHAFHSPLMEPMLDGLRAAAEQVEFSAPRVPMASGLTGELWPWQSAPDADYWCRQARQPVRFADGLRAIDALGCARYLEVGPAPSLLSLAARCLPPDPHRLLLPSLRPGVDDWEVLLGSVADLSRNGFDLDWPGFDRDYRRTVVDLPSYPFARTRSWFEPRTAAPGPGQPVDVVQPDVVQPGVVQPDVVHPDVVQPDDDVFYQIDWDRDLQPPEPAGDLVAVGRLVLLLGDSQGVADAVGTLLAHGPSRCVIARPCDSADVALLLADLCLADDDELEVVHLSSLDLDQPSGVDADHVVGSIVEECLSVTALAQAIMVARPAGRNRLWLVTRGAVSVVGEEPVQVAAASLWGLGRAMRTELPALWGGLVDLDPAGAAQSAALQLVSLLGDRGREDERAVRAGTWYRSRLHRASAPPAAAGGPAPWRADASYLVTGGLGGLGLAVARSMVGAGARRLVLLGRSAPPDRADWSSLERDDPWFERVGAVRALESMGASVLLASVDLEDASQVSGFLDGFARQGWPTLRGVVHAAGALEPGSMLELAPDALERQVAAKVGGAWALHQAFADTDLDLFVLFSSASAVLSSPYLGAYAAANAALDALAHLRRHQGLPAMSINWGFWSETGLAERERVGFGQARRGLQDLPPDVGVRIFDRLVSAGDATQVAVLPMDWGAWSLAHAAAARSPFLAGLVTGVTRRHESAARDAPTRDELLERDPAARQAIVSGYLAASIAGVLQVDDVDVDQPLAGIGLDSLMAVELKNSIESAWAVQLPIALLLDNASVRRLAEHVGQELSALVAGVPCVHAPIRRAARGTDADLLAAVLAEVESLSQEAVDTQIREHTS